MILEFNLVFQSCNFGKLRGNSEILIVHNEYSGSKIIFQVICLAYGYLVYNILF